MTVGKICCLFFALAVAQCPAAETMAYRFASEPVLDSPVSESPLLKEAPAPMPFVAPGDELHDLTQTLRTEKKIPLENSWVIWNQTQRLLIVHASMLDQWRVDQITGFQKQTRHAKFTVNWISSKDSTLPPAETDPVFASVTLLGLSGRVCESDSKLETESGAWSFSAGAAPEIYEDQIVTPFTCSWNAPEESGIDSGELHMLLVLRDNAALSVASWFPVGSGTTWRVAVKSEIQLPDGKSWREARLRQTTDRHSVSFPPIGEANYSELQSLPFGSDKKLLTMTLIRDQVETLSNTSHRKEDRNPFEEILEPDPVPSLPAVAVIPAKFGGVVSGPLLDLRESLLKLGVNLDAEDFVAYDPLLKRLIVHCKEAQPIEQLEQLVAVLDGGPSSGNIESSATLTDPSVPDAPLANFSILCRSGCKAFLRLQDSKEQEMASFSAEPTLEETPNINFRYELLCPLQKPAETPWHKKAKLTLLNDIPLVLRAKKLPDGRSINLGLRAKLVP